MTTNFVEIIGFAGHDPRHSGNTNTSRVRLSVATTGRWRHRDTGEERQRTEWHTVIFWDHLADIAADYVRKGSHILVTGVLRSRQYQDKSIAQTLWEIHARHLLLLDPRTVAANPSDELTPAPQSPPA